MSGRYTTLSSSQVTSELWQAFPASILNDEVCNSEYHLVTRDWVEKGFAPWFWEYLRARDLAEWVSRGNQCEHFAMRALLELVTLFCQAADREIDADVESVAAAWVEYIRDDGRKHAVLVIRVETGWEPWEPQTQQFFKFSAGEQKTVKKPFVL
jgi:hypothetical protein